MIKLTDQLKWAIVTMPGEEKDKLLLRLISKDDMLVKKLHHQLLEDDNGAKLKIIKLLALLFVSKILHTS